MTSPAAQRPGRDVRPCEVDRDSADHVVGTGTDRDRVARDIQLERPAKPIDPREPSTDPVGVEVGEVEVDAGVLRFGHLGGDRQRHVIARGELGESMIGRHEAFAVAIAEVGALAPQGFGQEMARRAGNVEHGGMELHEFHVAEHRAGAEGHGVAVGRGDRRVSRLAEELPGPSGREHDRPRPDQRQAMLPVPDQYAPAPAFDASADRS